MSDTAEADVTADTVARLRESEERFREFSTYTSDWYWEMSADLRYTFISEKFTSVTGVPGSEIVGKTTQDLLDRVEHELGEHAWGEFTALQQAHSEITQLECVILDMSGARRYIELSGRPLFTDDGAFAGYRGTGRDNSARKASEQALREAKDRAEQANSAKSEFLAKMSHEIRTPMNAVLGFAHLALETKLTDQQRDYITKMLRASTSLLGIIDDILDFSKIEAGKLQVERTTVYVEPLLREVSDMIVASAEKKGVEVIFSFDARIPRRLLGDPMRLRQVLLNLAGNGVKFTESGELVIGAEIVSERPGAVGLRFFVADTGMGLTEEQSAQLFAPFFQGDASTSRRFGGTGLGLTISKALVDMMGGEMSVASAPGEGSTFAFTVELGCDERVREPHDNESHAAGLRVLVVDDNQTARNIVSHTLSVYDFDVAAVESGEAALVELRRAHAASHERDFDLVLLDWAMPGLSGLQTAQRIREIPELPNPPSLIVMAGHGADAALEQAGELRLAGIVRKPVSPAGLLDTINAAIGSSDTKATGSHAPQRGFGLVGAKLDGARILLVEDNEINQQVACAMLEQLGAEVQVCDNGRQAVAAVNNDKFDLVLMDIEMPEMDGYAATREIRLRFDTAQLPIVAMTAHAMPGIREQCTEAGMNDHMAKPIAPVRLFKMVRRWINRERFSSRRSLAATASPLPDRLPGVDVVAGLRRVGGNNSLYRELLVRFRELYCTADADISEQVDAGDYHGAYMLAHSIAGSAVSLGAETVHSTSKVLSLALRAEQPTPELLARFSEALKNVMDGLARLQRTG